MSDELPASKWRSRKFLITAVAGLLATALVMLEKITGGEWALVATTCVGAYNAGNALASRR